MSPADGGPPPIPQCDLKRQYAALRDSLHQAIDRVLDGGWFILGPELEAFEREFADYCGAAHAVGVASGTDAITLTLRALGIGHGDEVIVPANTAFPTATAVTACGAVPVFADVDPLTANLDPVSFASRITQRTRAVVPVHLYGFPADLDALGRIASEHGLAVVEDAAQAHGTRYKGRRIGSHSSPACFSFYPTKNLGAFGDGGAIVTSDGELAGRLRMLRNYGQTRRYYHALHGYNSRLDELQAAILRVKLRHLDTWIGARRRLACRYHGALAGSGVEIPSMPPEGYHNYHLFVVRCPLRDQLLEFLASRGITALIHYPVPLHLQQAFAGRGFREGDCPAAERLASQVLSLPLFPEMTDSEVDRVAAAIREFHAAQ